MRLLSWFKRAAVPEAPPVAAPPIVDVQRNANGWPTTPVEDFTDEQLVREASRWAHMRGSPYVGGGQFQKYNDELLRRGVTHDWSGIELDWM